MDNRYNLYNLEALFKNYLLAGKNIDHKLQITENRPFHSPLTIKNYLSDFRHFQGWFLLFLKSRNNNINQPLDFIKAITPEFIKEYKSYLTENKVPTRTINRRLSTIRKFCSFCIAQDWIKENPAKHVPNVLPPQKVLNKLYTPKGKQEASNQSVNILAQFETDLQKEKVDKKIIISYLEDIREFLQI
jgi:site-specific recombinase XerC